jgi:hypothetical protein
MAEQTILWDYVDNSDSPISSVIDTAGEDGEGVACLIAEAANREESECFCEGGRITIFAPPEFVGSYDITAFYEPTFSADKVVVEAAA